MVDPKKNNKKRNSIYTLATDLNLNPGTVSRALRNRPEVSEETRMQVQKRADELGFKLKRFRPRTVNVCVLIQTDSMYESIFSSYVNAVIDGLWNYCVQNDLELSLYSSSTEKLNAGFLVRQLANRGAHGVVVLNASDESHYFRHFNKESFPYCALMDAPEEARAWTLRVDTLHLTRRALDYLIGLGHRRFPSLGSYTTRRKAPLYETRWPDHGGTGNVPNHCVRRAHARCHREKTARRRAMRPSARAGGRRGGF